MTTAAMARAESSMRPAPATTGVEGIGVPGTAPVPGMLPPGLEPPLPAGPVGLAGVTVVWKPPEGTAEAGQTMVVTGTVTTVVTVDLAGQLVTVGAQLVMVMVLLV